MKVIGLCGGSGSGKGEVGKLFCMNNIPVIDTDAVYHVITAENSPCLSELAEYFGKDIIDRNGALNRKRLAELVFSSGDGEKLNALNKITHKHILKRTRELLTSFSSLGYEFAVVDAPLLYESGFDSECDIIVSVIADKPRRIERIVARDSISREAAEKRISLQTDDAFLIANSDFVIPNNGTFDELSEQFNIVFEKIKNT